MFLEDMSSNGVIDSIIGLFNNQRYSDIKFKVDIKHIVAHKLILKTRCDYYSSMFSENWSQNDLNEIEVNDYSYNVFYAFLKYLYTDCVDINVEEVFDLKALAKFYCEEKLINKCDYIIRTRIARSDYIYFDQLVETVSAQLSGL